MIDLAKIADLAILVIDASFGFEMETFEFLNILQVSERRRHRAALWLIIGHNSDDRQCRPPLPFFFE